MPIAFVLFCFVSLPDTLAQTNTATLYQNSKKVFFPSSIQFSITAAHLRPLDRNGAFLFDKQRCRKIFIDKINEQSNKNCDFLSWEASRVEIKKVFGVFEKKVRGRNGDICGPSDGTLQNSHYITQMVKVDKMSGVHRHVLSCSHRFSSSE